MVNGESPEDALEARDGTLLHRYPTNSNQVDSVSIEAIGDGDAEPADLIYDIQYDAIGNMISRKKKAADGTTVLQQEFEYNNPLTPSLPTLITQTSVGVSEDDDVHYLQQKMFYDFSGTRIKRVTLTHRENDEGELVNDIKTTSFMPSGTENLAEMDQDGRITRAYQFAGGARIGYKSRKTHALYIKDHLGSTRQTFALYKWKLQDSGPVQTEHNRNSGDGSPPAEPSTVRSIEFAMQLAQSDTGPFGLGTRENSYADADVEPHRFTGQELEPELGIYYMGARFYDPDLGRFLQVDPAREFWNSYSYVGNSPVMKVDPTGMETPGEYHTRMSLESQANGDFFLASLHDAAAMVSIWSGYDVFVRPVDSLITKSETSWSEVLNSVLVAVTYGMSKFMPKGPKVVYQSVDETVVVSTRRTIQFGKTENQIDHAFRHIGKAGLDRATVRSTIVDDLAGLADDVPQGLTKRSVVVDGVKLDYNAYKLPDGTVNVGRITLPKPGG
jgi:RHS repeat-associated protein